MRGTRDADRIAYVERKPICGVSNVEEEEPRSGGRSAAGSVSKEVDSGEVSSARLSRESSPAVSKRRGVKSVTEKGILCQSLLQTCQPFRFWAELFRISAVFPPFRAEFVKFRFSIPFI